MKPLYWLSLALACVLGACSRTDKTQSGPPASASAELLSEGATAPAIDTTAHDGTHVSLAALKGKPVVLYFYPKDDTPGCTKEACEIRDAWQKIQETGAIVLGVSTDDNASHVAFAQKYQLPFKLLPDNDEKIAKAYGVPIRMGHAKRVTFIIDRQGKIAKVFPEVNPAGHATEIISALTALRT